MSDSKNITVSIVLYNEDLAELQKAISSALSIERLKKLYLIDNSPTNIIEKEFKNKNIEYLFVEKNIGFGAGHNLVLKYIQNNSDYHLILNPDTNFDPKIINELVSELEANNELSLIAPRVFFPNGKIQNSCRRYPKLSEMLFRRLPFINKSSNPLIKKGIYGDARYDIAKLRHSLVGLYDYIVGDLFQINTTENGFDYQLFEDDKNNHLAQFTDKCIEANGYKLREIKLIEGLLFLSMIPYHADYKDRQYMMYVRSLQILNELIK